MTRSPEPAGGAPPAGRDGTRLRLARLALRLSQHDLARAAGVTRQAVAGVESGRWDPSLRVALALSRALGLRVEDLFGPTSTLSTLAAIPLTKAPPSAAERVDLGQVGANLVALPLTGSSALRAGFAPAGGVLVQPQEHNPGAWEVRPTGPLRPTLLIAGCDPALPLLAGPLGQLEPPLALSWWPCGNREALALAAAGLVHAAGFHVAQGRGQGISERASAALAARGAEVIAFASWQEGLGLRAGVEASGLDEVAARRLRLVNREAGSEARELVEQEMRRHGLDGADVSGFDTAAGGHLLVAAALASGLGDVGVTTEPSARAYGLGFVPLAEERFLLAVSRPLIDTTEVRALLRVLASPGLQDQLAALPGYLDVARCGEHLASI